MLNPVFVLALALFVMGCSSSATTKDGVTEENLAAHAAKEAEIDAAAPGMIPAGCESLLNQSQAWGYIPGQKWKAGSAEQNLEVARFFGDFRLVPITTSDALRAFENGGPPPAADAQYCDVFLAQTFLAAVIAHPFANQVEKGEAGKQIHRFLLNQQALSLPLVHRSLTAQVFVGAIKKGLIPGSRAKALALGAWIEKAVAAIPAPAVENATPAAELKSLREQIFLSAKIRDRLGSLLPLP